VIEQTAQANAKGSAKAAISSSSVTTTASIEAGIQASVSESEKIEVSANIHFLTVTQSKTAEDEYRWSIEPRTNEILQGRPWDANKNPRLKIIDSRKDRTKGIPPTVRVEVRCRREDLQIASIEVKDENLWGSLKSRAGFRNRLAAAESYIRSQLAKEGLEVRDFSDIFGTVTLASTTAQSI
jgi:hypothetical protein